MTPPVDPDLTNSKCNLLALPLDADTSMKMEAMSSFMETQKDIKNVYILGQNYLPRRAGLPSTPRKPWHAKRPDIKIVGEDLHPLAQVRDFAPYIAKIKAAGSRRRHHWQLGLGPFLTHQGGQRERLQRQVLHLLRRCYGHAHRTPDKTVPAVYQVAYNHYNMGGQMQKWQDEFKAKHNDDFYTGSTIRIFQMLAPRWLRPSPPTLSRWLLPWKA